MTTLMVGDLRMRVEVSEDDNGDRSIRLTMHPGLDGNGLRELSIEQARALGDLLTIAVIEAEAP